MKTSSKRPSKHPKTEPYKPNPRSYTAHPGSQTGRTPATLGSAAKSSKKSSGESQKNSTYLDELQSIADDDVRILLLKDAAYGGSWKKRGGVNAWCMLCRKWDRIEQRMLKGYDEDGDPVYHSIFRAISEDEQSGRQETILEDISDTVRYLLLIRAEMKARMSHS